MSITDFLPLMPDTMSHQEKVGQDDYGKPLFGSEVTYRCRVVYKRKLLRGADAREIVANGMVWIAGTPDVDAEDRITLPDGSTPPIVQVEKYTDKTGLHHVKVYFG